jgi:uncharacterized membrane protein
MKLRYAFGALIGAAVGTGLGYMSTASNFNLSSLGIGALIGTLVGLFIVASSSANAQDAPSGSGQGWTGGG